MTRKKFLELVYYVIDKDKCNIYEACLQIKDHYDIDDETFVEFIKKEKTLKMNLYHCCSNLKLVKPIKQKSKNINSLF
jgi:ferredoxin